MINGILNFLNYLFLFYRKFFSHRFYLLQMILWGYIFFSSPPASKLRCRVEWETPWHQFLFEFLTILWKITTFLKWRTPQVRREFGATTLNYGVTANHTFETYIKFPFIYGGWTWLEQRRCFIIKKLTYTFLYECT